MVETSRLLQKEYITWKKFTVTGISLLSLKKKKDKAQKMLFLIVLLVAKAVSDGHQQSESIFATVLELYIHNS